jgi:hypothetical protein
LNCRPHVGMPRISILQVLWFYGNRVYETSWVVIELVERRRSCYERHREDRPIRISCGQRHRAPALDAATSGRQGQPRTLRARIRCKERTAPWGTHGWCANDPSEPTNRAISLEMARSDEPLGVAQRRCPEAFLIRLRACSDTQVGTRERPRPGYSLCSRTSGVYFARAAGAGSLVCASQAPSSCHLR